MTKQDKLIQQFKIALLQAAKDPFAIPGLVVRSAKVIGIIREGEKRRTRKEKELGMPVPYACVFSVTWRCNLECRGCYAANYPEGKEMEIDRIEATIRECIGLGVYLFVIAGGEPLMVEGLLERLANIKNAFFIFYTNGTKLERGHIRLLKAAGHILPVISIEGEEAMTDSRRGDGVGRKVAQAMHDLGRAGVIFGFSTMITHENLARVLSRAWLEELWGKGARYGFLIDYVPAGNNLEASFVLTGQDRALKEKLISERSREAKPPLFNLPPDEYADGQCKAAGKGIFHINADGNVEPCPFCHWAADNVKDKPIKDILDSDFFRSLRDMAAYLDNPRKECLLLKNENTVREIAAQTGAYPTD